MHSKAAFDYTTVPLNTSTRDIRLIRITGGWGNQDSIECELRVFPLASAPVYTALSYMWGAKTPIMAISVNSKAFEVRQNLWGFLRQMASESNRDYFWIDAICINQADIQERERQVGMMREIYRQAASVRIWLVPNNDDSQHAIDYIETLHQKKPTKKQRQDTWWDTRGRAIQAFCQNRYWRRVWIVQEIMLAQNIFIHYGAHSVSWEHLASMVDQLRSIKPAGSAQLHRYADTILQSHAARVTGIKKDWKHSHFDNKTTAFHYLLDQLPQLRCTDIRDQIYGLQGLLDHLTDGRSELLIPVNYSISPSQLSIEVYRRTEANFLRARAKSSWMRRLRDLLRLPRLDEMGYVSVIKTVRMIELQAASVEVVLGDKRGQSRKEEDDTALL